MKQTNKGTNQITCTCSDFQENQWCKHMPPGAVKTGWKPQQKRNRTEKIIQESQIIKMGIIETMNTAQSWELLKDCSEVLFRVMRFERELLNKSDACEECL